MQTANSLSSIARMICVLAGICAATVACAQRGGQRPDGPPAVAVEACTGLNEAAQCSFVGRRQDTLQGQCQLVQDDTMACVPEGHGVRPERGQRPDRSS